MTSIMHTPGPWHIGADRSKRNELNIISERDRYQVASAWGGCDLGDGRTTMHANARLIAAAPALLDACREALLWYGPDGDHVSDPARALLIAAVAKAEQG